MTCILASGQLRHGIPFKFPGARKSRRGSLDIYTAEYALKIGGGEKKGVTAMEQKTAFHMKVCRIMNSPLLLNMFLIFFMKLLYVAIAKVALFVIASK